MPGAQRPLDSTVVTRTRTVLALRCTPRRNLTCRNKEPSPSLYTIEQPGASGSPAPETVATLPLSIKRSHAQQELPRKEPAPSLYLAALHAQRELPQKEPPRPSLYRAVPAQREPPMLIRNGLLPPFIAQPCMRSGSYPRNSLLRPSTIEQPRAAWELRPPAETASSLPLTVSSSSAQRELPQKEPPPRSFYRAGPRTGSSPRKSPVSSVAVAAPAQRELPRGSLLPPSVLKQPRAGEPPPPRAHQEQPPHSLIIRYIALVWCFLSWRGGYQVDQETRTWRWGSPIGSLTLWPWPPRFCGHAPRVFSAPECSHNSWVVLCSTLSNFPLVVVIHDPP